jgi:hypothetical protein
MDQAFMNEMHHLIAQARAMSCSNACTSITLYYKQTDHYFDKICFRDGLKTGWFEFQVQNALFGCMPFCDVSVFVSYHSLRIDGTCTETGPRAAIFQCTAT